MTQDARQLVPALVLGAAVALTAALGSLLYTERAAVKVTIAPQRLEARATIDGGLSGSVLTTTRLDLSSVQSEKVSTNTSATPATFASGQALFSCMPQCPGGYTVPAGTVIGTAKNVTFQTLAMVVIPPNGPAPLVNVRAIAGGTTGNAVSGTVNVIVSHLPSNLHVTNPKAISGGAAALPAGVVIQADYDALRSMLTDRVTSDLVGKLKQQTAGMSYVTQGPPTVGSSSDYNVGDKAAAFTITVTAHLKGVAFAKSDARALLVQAVGGKIPAGYQLTSDPVRTTYRIVDSSINSGYVTIAGTAVAYAVPKAATAKLLAQLRGLSVVEARSRLQRSMPGGTIDIHLSPVALPWLPMLTDHITMDVIPIATPE